MCPAPVHEYREANKKKIYSGNASKEAGTTGKGGISTAQRSVKRGYRIAVMEVPLLGVPPLSLSLVRS